MKKATAFLLIPLLMVGLEGCSVRKTAIDEMARMTESAMSVFETDNDLDMLEKAVPAHIKLFEVLLENDPTNPRLLVLLARMYGSYGFAFYETRLEGLLLGVNNRNGPVNDFSQTNILSTKDKLENYYRKGAEYALRALEVSYKNCRRDMADIKTADGFFQKINKKDVGALFWYGFNLGSHINLNRDSVAALSKVYLVEKAMLRVVELDPDYFHAGAHIFLISFYASRSPMMGGNLDGARYHYEEAIRRTDNALVLAHVFFARYYLYQKQEREAFEKTLKEALFHAPVDAYALLNRVAVDRARIYLAAADDLFP